MPVALLPLSARAEPDYASAIRADYDASLVPVVDYFHRNPELSFRGVNTAARMAKELRAIPGIIVTEKVAARHAVAGRQTAQWYADYDQ